MTREQNINDIQDANVGGRFAPSPNGKRSAEGALGPETGMYYPRRFRAQCVYGRTPCKKERAHVYAAKYQVGRDFWRANDPQVGAIRRKDPGAARACAVDAPFHI